MKGGCRGILIAVLVACGDDAGPVAVYQVPTTGALAWGDAPFPNQLYLGSDGTLDIAALPATSPVWEAVRADLDARVGFCGTCPVHVPIRGVLDPATLAGNVVLIDSAGERVPIDVEWDATSSAIAVQPSRGLVLVPGTEYTLGVTSAVRDVSGNALRADGGFSSARARAVVDGAVARLASAGVRDVVSATSWTIEDPRWLADDIAARVATFHAANGGAPLVTVERVWKASDGTLDALMGTPAASQPGLDNPAQAGSIGEHAVAHETTAIVIKGTLSSVRVITGSGSELGTLRDDTVAGGPVPFLLAIPSGVDVTQLPVIVFHHGATGQLAQVLALADIAGRAHAAILGLETFQHGERSPGATDSVHELRGDAGELGPDGFFEHSMLTVGLRLFALEGVPAEHKASPLYVRGTFAQMAADYHAALAMVRGSDLSALAQTDASLNGLAFDESRVFYLGLSLGTLVGAVVLAADAGIAAGAFNVPLSSIVDTLLENEAFRTQTELLMLGALGIPNETYEPERQLKRHPLFGFYRWVLHPVEPIALARHNASRPGRDLLWQIAGLDELAGTPAGEALVAAAGVPGVGEFTHAPVVPGTAPLAGTAAWRFAQADHFMLGYRAGESAVEAPGLPPFERRPAPLVFDNPIDEVHAQLSHFFETRRATGTAEIRLPAP